MTHVGIVGAGSIGSAFGVLFADADMEVWIYDPVDSALQQSRDIVEDRLHQLSQANLLTSEPGEALSHIQWTTELADAVTGADLVQEAVPENVEIKRDIFTTLTSLTSPTTILASSSSAIPSSRFADASSRERTMIAHPGNPPFLLRIIEVVANPDTGSWALERAQELYGAADLTPVSINREIEGFVFNRLQGALLREAYALVRDGIVDADGIDTLVRDGLGLRWAARGPFATCDLNVRGGIRAHAQRMGESYRRMGQERGQDDPWTEEMIAAVEAARRREVPLDRWDQEVAHRDAELIGLLATRKNQNADFLSKAGFRQFKAGLARATHPAQITGSEISTHTNEK